MALKTFRRRVWLPLALIFGVAVGARAQQKLLTLDEIYDPATRVAFSGNPAPALEWIDERSYAWPREAGSRSTVDWLRVDAATGSAQPLFDAATMEAAIAKLPGVAADEARRLSRSRDLVFDTKYSAAILTIANDLYVYQFDGDRVVRLTSAPGESEHPSFSPDGKLVAFIRDNNLHVSDVSTEIGRAHV